MKSRITLLGLLVCATAPTYADVYKCTQNGKTTFSDTPCALGTAPIQTGTPGTSGGAASQPRQIGEQSCRDEAAQQRLEVVAIRGGEMQAVSYAGTSLPARRYSVMAQRVRTQDGEKQVSDASFVCFTSEDGRRILREVQAESGETSTKNRAITAPARDNGLSETRDRRKAGKSRALDEDF